MARDNPGQVRATRLLVLLLLTAVGASLTLWRGTPTGADVYAQAPDPCGAGSNPIVCENSKPGNLASEWDVSGAGDSTIQGFATDISVNRGQTVRFKIDTSTTNPVRLDIYRIGYYSGRGARRITPVEGISATPTNQPTCLTNAATGLVDCGNWSESASWTVPATAVSGIYFARAVRTDTNGASHIFFIVREDDVRTGGAGSDILFQTSDTTWQAYNQYGGNSLYVGTALAPAANRAYKVSYNRPFTTREYAAEDWVFNAEYPMVRWLEANGYDVTYTTGVDTDRRGPDLINHKAFLSVGHDEYWSGGQRANVETARAAGVHLGFFSGNEAFWKTRWENSIDGSNTQHRTLVCYKETHADQKIDPSLEWTGTWRDPRFSPPADGGRPENALTGTASMVNDGATTNIQVPAGFANLRFWRNTPVANLQSGQTATLGTSTLGYEWDEDLDNGFRPAGLINLSRTTVAGAPVLQDYGSTYGSATATHSLTLYRHTSGALVFGAGTVQWSWGLDSIHDRGSAAASLVMQQATVNLFADMGAQPLTPQPGLVTANASADTVAPSSTITSPVNNDTVAANSVVTISGTAADTGGTVAGVDVSVDGGTTWQRASGSTSWTFSWATGSDGTASIRSRAFDDSGLIETPSTGVTVTVVSGGGGGCPCSIWSLASVPVIGSNNDPNAVELGVKFRSSVAGYVTGIRYYKSSQNTGTHVGHLWTAAGALLSEATFTGESSSGWQQVIFASPVAITANTSYVASYYTPTGFYAGDNNYFTANVTNGPLTALADGVDGGNGVYRYGAGGGFPNETFGKTNYWVDVVFAASVGPDTTAPLVSTVSPVDGASGVSTETTISIRFSEPMDAATINTSTIELRDPANAVVSSTVTWSAGALTATVAPTSILLNSTVYTLSVKGGATDPRVKDTAGNALAAPFTSTFTTAAPSPPPDQGPGGPILVVASGDNPFTRYYAEILRAEGLNAFTVTDVSLVSATTLAAYDVVILGQMPLTAAQVAMFTGWVNGGGNLVAMRPDKGLATLMGLTDENATLADGYLFVDTASAPGAGIVGETIQYHGTADRYTLNGARQIATLYSDAETATLHPAVTVQDVGTNGGQAAAFTFDLARSVVYTRQGNPAWSGQERDGFSPIRSDDLFFGNAAADPKPDWVDLDKVAIPQADEQQRLLANLIGFMNTDRKPLPRFWYFPRGKKAVVVMTGDDHANGGTSGRFDIYKDFSPASCSVADWECVRSTSYLYPGTPLTDAQAAAYTADGFEVALHVNTNCVDWTPTTLGSFFSDQRQQWTLQFPSLPPPTTNRTHCIAWSDYSTQPQVSLTHGIRLDTTYYYWPGSWVNDRPGFFTGSGMPMRFATASGAMIDVYQAVTQMPDEAGQTYPFTIDTLLDRAIGPEGYYGAFTANMHTDQDNIPQSDAIVASAIARGVPVVSARQMLQWLDGRNGSSFGNFSWTGTTLSFVVAVGSGANGLQAMVPASASAGPLTGIARNGSPITYALNVIKGVQYAVFDARAGSYQAAYTIDTTAPVISAVTVTPTNTAATITWTTNEPSTSNVDYGKSASLGSAAGGAALVTSHTVSLAGLTPSTTYFFRVSSADASDNTAVSPVASDPPASFTTTAAPPPVGADDSTIVDFSAGTPDANTYFAQTADGEITLAPAVGAEFSGSVLPTGWSSTQWNAGGTAVVSGGRVSVDGSRVSTDALFGPGRSLEFVATFTTQAFQHAGLGIDLNDAPWAIFSTHNGGSLYARTNNGTGSTDTLLTGSWLGAPHRYRIDWTASALVYWVDGTQVASHELPIAVNLRPIVSDLNVSAALFVDWMRLSPYASATTFLSRVFDGGGSTDWGPLGWSSAVPAGTTLAMSVRTGNTATPDGSWTGFSAVATSGGDVPGVGRYVQYRAQLATSDPTITPALAEVTIGGDPGSGGQPSVSVGDVSVTEGNAGTANAVFTVSLSESSTQTATVEFVTANGTASAGTDYTAASDTLTFAAGTLTQTVSVPVLGDTTQEPNETFTLNLSNPTNATIARAQGTGTITNDDSPPFSIVVTPPTASIAAGGSQTYAVEAFDASNNSLGIVTGPTTFAITDGSCTGATCTATVAGAHTVTATYAGITGTASLTVSPSTFDHLVLSPAVATIPEGGSLTYTADGRDSFGNSLGPQSGVVFTIAPEGSCTASACTAVLAGPHTVTGTKGTATGTAALTVIHVNLAPVAANDTYGTDQDVALTVGAPGILANDSDLDGPAALTVALGTAPSQGTLVLNPNGSFTYTPAANFAGTDSFTYTASDGAASSPPATVTITVRRADIVFRSASFTHNKGAGTIAFTKPAGLAQADVMVAAIDALGTGAITPPSGWTLLLDHTNGTLRQVTYFRVADAAEPATYTWSFGSQRKASGGIVAYIGVDPAHPVDIAAGQVNSSSTSITIPSVVTSVPSTRLVGVIGTAINATVTPPGGMAERGEITSGTVKVTTAIADAQASLAGSTGQRTAVASGAAVNIGQVVALRSVNAPAVAPQPPAALTAVATESQVTLNWTASVGAAEYSVHRATTAGGGYSPLAAGLTATSYVDSTVLNGIPYHYVVRAANTAGESGNSPEATATPACATITPSPATLAGGEVAVPYSQTITSIGGIAPHTYGTAGQLPPGITLSAAGLLSGTPSTAGTYTFVVTATDAKGCAGTRSYSIAVRATCPTITLSPASLPGAKVGTTYALPITAAGSTGSYTFSVSSGALPSGLSLSAGGTLAGTPKNGTGGKTYTFAIRATDASGCAGTKSYTFAVSK